MDDGEMSIIVEKRREIDSGRSTVVTPPLNIAATVL